MYTSCWSLTDEQASRLQQYLGSDHYASTTSGCYAESDYWRALSQETFAAVKGNVVIVRSGHAFREPIPPEAQRGRRRLQRAAVELLARVPLVLEFCKRAGRLAEKGADEAESLRVLRLARAAFQRLLAAHPEDRAWAERLLSGLAQPRRLNEPKVYDDLENMLLLHPFAREGPGMRFLEIGAGAGLTSLCLLERYRGSRVVICDLPATIAVGYTLLSQFAGDRFRLVLPHEISQTVLQQGEFDLAFLTPNQAALIEDGSVDAVVNVSSMQEMTPATIQAYFELIRRVGKPDAVFFCKNLETSKQNPDVQFARYPWELLGAVLNDGVAQYTTEVYGQGRRVVRVRVVRTGSQDVSPLSRGGEAAAW